MVVPGLPAILLAAPVCVYGFGFPVVAAHRLRDRRGHHRALWGGFDWGHHDVDINVTSSSSGATGFADTTVFDLMVFNQPWGRSGRGHLGHAADGRERSESRQVDRRARRGLRQFVQQGAQLGPVRADVLFLRRRRRAPQRRPHQPAADSELPLGGGRSLSLGNSALVYDMESSRWTSLLLSVNYGQVVSFLGYKWRPNSRSATTSRTHSAIGNGSSGRASRCWCRSKPGLDLRGPCPGGRKRVVREVVEWHLDVSGNQAGETGAKSHARIRESVGAMLRWGSAVGAAMLAHDADVAMPTKAARHTCCPAPTPARGPGADQTRGLLQAHVHELPRLRNPHRFRRLWARRGIWTRTANTLCARRRDTARATGPGRCALQRRRFLPYTWLPISGQPADAARHCTGTQDSVSGFGDLTLVPAMLAWKTGNWQVDALMPIYAPTGSYEKGRLGNSGPELLDVRSDGRRRPTATRRTGFNAMLHAGLCDQHREPGHQLPGGSLLHFDGAIEQILPAGPGFLTLGVEGLLFPAGHRRQRLGRGARGFQGAHGRPGAGARIRSADRQAVAGLRAEMAYGNGYQESTGR